MLEILECCTTKEEMNSSPHVLLVEYEKSPSMRITIEAHMNHLTSLSLYVSLEKISHRYKCQWKNEHHDHIGWRQGEGILDRRQVGARSLLEQNLSVIDSV